MQVLLAAVASHVILLRGAAIVSPTHPIRRSVKSHANFTLDCSPSEIVEYLSTAIRCPLSQVEAAGEPEASIRAGKSRVKQLDRDGRDQFRTLTG